jgi:hypothetical protein
MESSPRSDRAETAGDPSPARKPYRPPVLTEYGSVAKLTRSNGSTTTESGMPQMMMMFCL